MKWMIASDIHGSAYWCEKMLDCYAKEGRTDCFFSAIYSITDRGTICRANMSRKGL